MFLLLAPLAAAAEITVFTETPAAVTVDGQLVDYEEASLLLVARNLKAGKHVVKVATIAGKPVTETSVVLQATERADLVYGQMTLVPVGGGRVGEPAVTARYAAVPVYGADAPGGGGRVGAGGGYAGVNAGSGGAAVVMSDGMGGTVSVSAGMPTPQPTVVVVTQAAPKPPPPPPTRAEPPKPEPVQVIFSLKDSFDMSNVYVDGKRVAEFRTGDDEKSVTLMSGPHTIEIKEFTEFKTWFKGTLTVTPGEPLRFGYGQDEGVEVYNRPAGVWAPK